ncbi:type I DNA topoisomerase [Candidatus Kaiserbacteria bacterium]|nr:type I DNA topoisomerase [Candidatus Kaiserbacteria bacterium]
MSTLVIVESPAKAKTIEKYLGSEYRVRASVGHVRDLPKSNKDAVDIAGGFVPHYVVSEGKQKIITELRKEAKKADAVLLATDPDREGEAIAWHIAELIKKDNKNIKRVAFHEITESAVTEAIKHPREIDQHLRSAQEARRVLDRLVGYDLSGLIWKKVRYGLSAGRVQSPALRILMEREREIRAFKPEDFWTITAETETKKKEKLSLTCVEEPRDEEAVKDIVAKGTDAGKKGAWVVTDVKETEMKRAPRPPFTTSTLQQTASTRLVFSPSRTMGAAQKLYEAGLITYMRTDSVSMSSVAEKQILALVHSEHGEQYVQPRSYKTKSKSAQEAHEAIRPTNFAKRTAGATDDQKKLYALIFERAVSSQMADARLLRTKITANITDKSIPDFTANGSRVMFDGWLKVDYRARGEDVEVPNVSAQDPLALLSIESFAKQTQPPSRYSEAGLIKELEQRGIGRPSTYASIIKTIVDREYVTKEGRTLIPTDTGDVVSSFLEDNFAGYISDTFTSEMEDELDDIAAGTREYEKTLKDFYTPFTKDVASKETIDKLTTLGDAPKEFPCPKCGKDMVVKLGRGGKFLSCSDFPACMGARMNDGSELKSDEPLGKHPETGEDIFIMNGRFGPYVQLGKTPEKVKRGRKGKKDSAAKGESNVGNGTASPRRASIPKGKKPEEVTVEDAVRYLALPRILGRHPETGEDITASIGRFGPFIVHQKDFRSLKGADNPYDITLPRALEILKEEKKTRGKRPAKK